MAIHDWARVEAGIFHHFHHQWTGRLADALNGGSLPEGFFALAEQVLAGPIPDVVTLQARPRAGDLPRASGAVALAEAPPKARFVRSADSDLYAAKANRIVIRHRLGRVVAVIEIVSPGNKGSLHALRAITDKAAELLRQGINLLVVDLFPPSPRDPQGIHGAIWEQFNDEPFELPPDKPLTAAAYSAGPPLTAYVEPLAVGDALPDLPIFLDPDTYVPAPLEPAYQATWRHCPAVVREMVENPAATG